MIRGCAAPTSSTYAAIVRHGVNCNTRQYTYSQILKWTRILNVSESRLQIFQLYVDFLHCLLSLDNCCGLECLNSLDVCVHVICYRLEFPEKPGSIIDNSFVLKNGTVVFEVDCGRLGRVLGVKTLGFTVSFTERLKSRDRLYSKFALARSISCFEQWKMGRPLPRPRVE